MPVIRVPGSGLKRQAWIGSWLCAQASADSKSTRLGATSLKKPKKLKASILTKVEHPIRVIKRLFGYTKVRCRD